MVTPTLATLAAKPETARQLPRAERFALGQQALAVAWVCLFSLVEEQRDAPQNCGALLTVKEAAPLFGVRPTTLYKLWKTDPRIRACTVDNGTDKPVFDPVTVREWQEKRRRGGRRGER